MKRALELSKIQVKAGEFIVGKTGRMKDFKTRHPLLAPAPDLQGGWGWGVGRHSS